MYSTAELLSEGVSLAGEIDRPSFPPSEADADPPDTRNRWCAVYQPQ